MLNRLQVESSHVREPPASCFLWLFFDVAVVEGILWVEEGTRIALSKIINGKEHQSVRHPRQAGAQWGDLGEPHRTLAHADAGTGSQGQGSRPRPAAGVIDNMTRRFGHKGLDRREVPGADVPGPETPSRSSLHWKPLTPFRVQRQDDRPSGAEAGFRTLVRATVCVGMGGFAPSDHQMGPIHCVIRMFSARFIGGSSPSPRPEPGLGRRDGRQPLPKG